MMNRPWAAGLGIALGAVALGIAAVHVAAGPFDREPPLDEVVAEKARSVYEALRQQFAAEESAATEEPPKPPPPRGIDRLLHATTAGLGAAAVALALAGFTRREDSRACGSAAVLGIAAMPWLNSVGVLAAALIVSLAWRLLPSNERRRGERVPVDERSDPDPQARL